MPDIAPNRDRTHVPMVAAYLCESKRVRTLGIGCRCTFRCIVGRCGPVVSIVVRLAFVLMAFGGSLRESYTAIRTRPFNQTSYWIPHKTHRHTGQSIILSRSTRHTSTQSCFRADAGASLPRDRYSFGVPASGTNSNTQHRRSHTNTQRRPSGGQPWHGWHHRPD